MQDNTTLMAESKELKSLLMKVKEEMKGTLCGPIDGSPPGSPFPGTLQARTLEWGAIAFSERRAGTK